jgi:hypothetical protein
VHPSAVPDGRDMRLNSGLAAQQHVAAFPFGGLLTLGDWTLYTMCVGREAQDALGAGFGELVKIGA